MEEQHSEIHSAEIQQIATTLKKLDKKTWAKKLAELIAKKEKIDFNETKVYTIVNGGVKNYKYKQYFVTHGNALIQELTQTSN